MKFTVETESFIRLMEMLDESAGERKRSFGPVKLSAYRLRLSVERHESIAQIEAVVWQEGQCTVSAARLLSSLRACRGELNLKLELAGQRLRVGESLLPVFERGPAVAANARRSWFYLKTNQGVVASPGVPECEFAFA